MTMVIEVKSWAAALASPFGLIEMRLRCDLEVREAPARDEGPLAPGRSAYYLNTGLTPAEPMWIAATDKLPTGLPSHGIVGILAVIDHQGRLTRPPDPPRILTNWLAENAGQFLAEFLAKSDSPMGWAAPEPAIQPPPQ